MKKLLLVFVSVFCLQSNAAVVGSAQTPAACEGACAAMEAVYSTFSFPTVLFHDKELNLGSEEATLIILSEIYNEDDNQPVSQALAEHLKTSVSEVQKAALEHYQTK